MVIEADFDRPIYKVLARNDTGDAPGHQGGFVVPKDLETYFPLLFRETSSQNPTVDQTITADLFFGSNFLASVETRYQYQTWGGARSPERRITGNISALRNAAHENDILLIEKSINRDNHYRFTLIGKFNANYDGLIQSFAGRRWGLLDPANPPVDELLVEAAEQEIAAQEHAPFALFDPDAGIFESRIRKISRTRAFQKKVRNAYNGQCAVCSGGLVHPKGMCEAEAAHIVSRSLKGTDDTRNGLLLCKVHHWAFDYGMIGIDNNYKIIIPSMVLHFPQNIPLSNFINSPLNLPKNQDLWPSKDALLWHRENLYGKNL